MQPKIIKTYIAALLNTIIFCTFIWCPATVAQEMTAASLPSYLEPLLKASSVTGRFGGLGVPAKDYPLFEKALNDKSLKQSSLKKAMKSATPAGKLYVAMIMLKHYPKEAETALKTLADNSKQVQIQEGCIVQEYSLSKAAKELLTKGTLASISPPK